MRPLQFEKKLEKLIWVCWGDTFEKDVFVSLGNVLFRPLAEETKPELRSAFQIDSWCEPKTDLTQRDFSFFFVRVCVPNVRKYCWRRYKICKMGNTNVGEHEARTYGCLEAIMQRHEMPLSILSARTRARPKRRLTSFGTIALGSLVEKNTKTRD